MRFHLIDQIESYEPSYWVRARKVTSGSEEFWEDSPGGPIMPPPLVLESLCQAATWLIMLSTARRKRAALLSIGAVAFLAEVHPGDVLELEGVVDSMGDESAVITGQARVDGQTVMEAKEVMCALIDATDLEDDDGILRMQRLLTRG